MVTVCVYGMASTVCARGCASQGDALYITCMSCITLHPGTRCHYVLLNLCSASLLLCLNIIRKYRSGRQTDTHKSVAFPQNQVFRNTYNTQKSVTQIVNFMRHTNSPCRIVLNVGRLPLPPSSARHLPHNNCKCLSHAMAMERKPPRHGGKSRTQGVFGLPVPTKTCQSHWRPHGRSLP